MEQYDYIICGAGCAGLSLAYRLSDSSFSHLKVLVLDKEEKNKNDRTWCFWAKDSHPFEAIVYKCWDKINFYGDELLERLDIDPYSYQMIRGIDFYEYTLDAIRKCDHITVRYEGITSIQESEDKVSVKTDEATYQAKIAFSSIVKTFPEHDDLFVWQHFKGWVVKSNESCFDKNVATFMDFRIEQGEDTRFVYVLPHTDRRALIEATVFSRDIWDTERYDQLLRTYCKDFLKIDQYEILDEEIGAIPMTTATFDDHKNKRIIPIGTLNGTVKPSSGYTFTRIQQECDSIISQIQKDAQRVVPNKNSRRFLAYDRTLLNVLLTHKESGKRVFSMMFKKNKAKDIFQFLDEKSNLLMEVGIFKTLPFFSFLRAFLWENVIKRTKP